MVWKRLTALLLSAMLAISLLTACFDERYSTQAARVVNAFQRQLMIEFSADNGLAQALKNALASGDENLRTALLTQLELSSALNFTAYDLARAKAGQHVVQVWEISAYNGADAAEKAAAYIWDILANLKASGTMNGDIGMIKHGDSYYIVVDVKITDEDVFDFDKPESDEDDTGSAAPTVKSITVSGLSSSYTVNESIEKENLTVLLTLSDGTTRELTEEEFELEYNFTEAGQKEVKIIYNANPSVYYITSVTVAEAYTGKKIAIFTAGTTPLDDKYERVNWEKVREVLVANDLLRLRGQIQFYTDTPLSKAMANVVDCNHAIDLDVLHGAYLGESTNLIMVDWDKLADDMNQFNNISYISVDVTKENVIVDKLEETDVAAAEQLKKELINKINEIAPTNGQAVNQQYCIKYRDSSEVGFIREYLGNRNFKYYAVVALKYDGSQNKQG